ncbi:MAG: GNAT family N-acetyltransferase [Burkholderiales bacterium]|nr:GNAT family N-acetyltransferase [Burkholderiales bacterium]
MAVTLQFSDPRIALRPASSDDDAFLRRVYASTREAELALTDWGDEAKRSFVDMQYSAQQQAYSGYANAECFVVLHNAEPVGRLYLQYGAETLSIVDLSLLTAWRGVGIGSAILSALLGRAKAEGKAVRMHVEKLNPALRLYQRHGFCPIEDRGVYLLLEWRAEITPSLQIRT